VKPTKRAGGYQTDFKKIYLLQVNYRYMNNSCETHQKGTYFPCYTDT
jgi:hypothetical protein